MKKITYSVAFVATLLATSNTFAQQGFGTNTPHRSAAVEIKSTNKGLLIPRVDLRALTGDNSKLNDFVPNAESLLVYHLGANNIPAGYYYWDPNYVTPAVTGNGTESSPQFPAVTGKWIAFSTVGGSNALGAENALTLNTTTNKVELGGDLLKNTAINFGTNNFTLNLNTGKFIINNLSQIVSTVPGTRPAMNLLVNSTQPGESGQVFTYTPSNLLADYLIGTNGVTVGINPLTQNSEVKLGGNLTENTTIHTQGFDVKIQGLELYNADANPNTSTSNSIAALAGNVVAVGNAVDGKLAVATAEDIVKAGMVPDSGIEWLPVDANNTDSRKVVLGGTLDRATTITTSTTNTLAIDGMTVNTNQQLGGKHVVLADATTGVLSEVAISDLVESAQANIEGEGAIKVVAANNTNTVSVSTGNGIQQYGTGANAYIGIGGTVTEDTTLTIANGASVKVQGISSTTNLEDQMVAVGHYQTGELKVARPVDIVNQGLDARNGLDVITEGTGLAQKSFVELGGALTKETTITTTNTNTLAIAGLTSSTAGNSKNIVVDKDNKLRFTEKLSVNAPLTSAPTNTNTEASTTDSLDEIIYKIALTGDQTIYLPNATALNKGQEVNVIIESSNELGTLFISGSGGNLDITSAGYSAVSNLLAYGGMNGQKWTFKSNGSDWEIVSRM